MVGGNQRTLQILSIYNFFLEGNIYPQSKSCRLSLAFPSPVPSHVLFLFPTCETWDGVGEALRSAHYEGRNIDRLSDDRCLIFSEFNNLFS
jgi:hypothetical protein